MSLTAQTVAAPSRSGPDFSLDEEQELLRQQVRRFAEERIRPGVAERDREHRFPAEAVAEMGELGLLGMMVEERYGGGGADVLTYLLAVEELARVCPSSAVTMSVSNSVCCWPIAHFGSEELKRRTLPELAAGALGGFGLTEPGAGSDPSALRTAARRDGDDWLLTGEKAWITNAGLKIALATLDHSRLGIAAQAIGIHQRALELAAGYARERVQFGVPIARHQAVQFRIAQIAMELAAARLLAHRAALAAIAAHAAEGGGGEGSDGGGTPSESRRGRASLEAGRLAAEAKLYASEAANRACQESLQVHGGYGFHEDYEISRLYRDVRVTTIYEGTSEMQRLVIARHLLQG